MPAAQLNRGLYQHYKGAMYRVLGVSTHSESGEALVLYQALYGERGLWNRPYAMFVETVQNEHGMTVPRFAYCTVQSLVLEVAKLTIVEGQTSAFLAAFAQAEPLIKRQAGYVQHSLITSAQTRDEFLLQVVWLSIEAHREGFRQSEDYSEWQALLHHFYAPFPTVEYYRLEG